MTAKLNEAQVKTAMRLIESRDSKVNRLCAFKALWGSRDRLEVIISASEGNSVPVFIDLTKEHVELLTADLSEQIEEINSRVKALGIITIDEGV